MLGLVLGLDNGWSEGKLVSKRLGTFDESSVGINVGEFIGDLFRCELGE